MFQFQLLAASLLAVAYGQVTSTADIQVESSFSVPGNTTTPTATGTSALSTSEKETITFLAPGRGTQIHLSGTVVSQCPDTTVLALQCPSETSADLYGRLCTPNEPPVSYTVGPSIFRFRYATSSAGEEFEFAYSCGYEGTTQASCTQYVSSSSGSTSTETRVSATFPLQTHEAVITGHTERLNDTGVCEENDDDEGDSAGVRIGGGSGVVCLGLVAAASFVGMLLL